MVNSWTKRWKDNDEFPFQTDGRGNAYHGIACLRTGGHYHGSTEVSFFKGTPVPSYLFLKLNEAETYDEEMKILKEGYARLMEIYSLEHNPAEREKDRLEQEALAREMEERSKDFFKGEIIG